MHTFKHMVLIALLLVGGAGYNLAAAQSTGCPSRDALGFVVNNPLDLYSSNGVLNVAFTLRSEVVGFLEECYIYAASTGAVEAPTLHLDPGDHLVLALTNRLSYVPPPPLQRPMTGMNTMAGMSSSKRTDACGGGAMVATSTNIHFHGLNIPPVCHQDEVINTTVENTDPPFEYRFQVPPNDAPGMYWYHPHLHGESTLQVNGGAAGALIVNGMEKVKPQVGGLPERVFVIRQQFNNPNSWLAGPSQLTLNFHPANSAGFPPSVIQMQPGVKEFWRVANASSQAFLTLAVNFGDVAQPLEIIALDGIPVSQTHTTTSFALPPAGRVEFIVTGPPVGQSASFWQTGFDTGPIGNPNLAVKLADIQATTSAEEPAALPLAPAARPASIAARPQRFAALDRQIPLRQRKLYFSEATNGSNGPTEFFITVEGHRPKVFEPSDPPAITTTVGAVEDWTVENRTGESHAFHIHQVHFLFMATNDVAEPDPQLRDTVVVPAWTGTGPYPSVKLRMDFRDPEIAGTFVFHCHVLDHEDAGMMAKIRVNARPFGTH